MRLALLMMVLVATSAAPAEPARVRRGMSRDEVRALYGPPARVSRVLLMRRHAEQWHYDDPQRWVEFNCVRGEEQHVARIRPDR